MKSELELWEKTCSVCGKTFIAAPQHVYRDARYINNHHPLVCSWKCVCESERLKGGDKRKTRRYTYRVGYECEDGFRGNVKEVAAHLGVVPNTVYRNCRYLNLKKYKITDDKA